MKDRIVPIADLAPAAYNPRLIPELELAKLKESITRFGFVEPVVVNERTMTIVGGHQRVLAASDLGILEVPCVLVDLDEAAERTLNVALNAIEGEWDRPKLAALLGELRALEASEEATGLDRWELDSLRAEIAAEGSSAGAVAQGHKCPRCGEVAT